MPAEENPQFSIVTPSFRNSEWLKLCIASVADQEGVSFEHIVQDAGSDDGTLDWLPTDPRVRTYIEKDQGMYDAVNRGFARAGGEILAYLNCDEQYLPGALHSVASYFKENPEADLLLADTVVVDVTGKYICHRLSLRPNPSYIWLRFPALTCSMFFRRELFDKRGFRFDPNWAGLGDMIWMRDILRSGVHTVVMRRFTSVFTETGGNLGLTAVALRETQKIRESSPAWTRAVPLACILHHRLRLLLSGAFTQKPFEYSLYTTNNPVSRVTKRVDRPSPIWASRR